MNKSPGHDIKLPGFNMKAKDILLSAGVGVYLIPCTIWNRVVVSKVLYLMLRAKKVKVDKAQLLSNAYAEALEENFQVQKYAFLENPGKRFESALAAGIDHSLKELVPLNLEIMEEIVK